MLVSVFSVAILTVSVFLAEPPLWLLVGNMCQPKGAGLGAYKSCLDLIMKKTGKCPDPSLYCSQLSRNVEFLFVI